ncbi:MAG TPA: hypothetical protein DEA96_07985 [Leptospiraceae bacterium]|nr:hypothetical protein [Spirochaetaceae bacterium]HBS04887.1 hypothetical protein [Leptospiraceae bacterium]|tara:strand:- start:48148 stop:51579 length:3432 start_codon:yes stop_codon:yes gene_type:complete
MITTISKLIATFLAALLLGTLSFCIKDYPEDPLLLLAGSASLKLGGEVLGLNGSLTLSNGGDTVVITSDGAFQFPGSYASGSPYNVQITDSPINQECTVSSGAGVMLANITTVFVECTDTAVTIDSIQRPYLSSQGGAHNISTFDWTPEYTENFEIRIGADCSTGALSTWTNNSGTTTTSVQQTSGINQTDLVPGPNTIHVCILDGSSNVIDSNSFTIVRDDVSPTVTLSVTTGTFASAQSVSVSCTDPASGCNATVYTIQDVALPGAANPADPAVTTDGTPTTGVLYAGPLNAADLRNTQIEVLAIDRAGNRSALAIGNYTVDATLPVLSLSAPTREFVSNTAGAPYNSSDLTWTSNRSNMDYFIWYGATDCQGTAGTLMTSGTTTGAGDTVTVNAAMIPVGTHTITVAERNLAGFYGCQTTTLTRDDTPPTLVAGGTSNGDSIAYNGAIDIRLSEQIDTGSISVGGGDLDAEASLPPVISTTSNTDDTIQIFPMSNWSAGLGRVVDVDVRDRAGNLLTLNWSLDLPDGTVEPMYAAAPNWNQHIRNDGSFIYDAAGTLCDGSETGFITSCLHGGELRKVQVLNETSCAGLSATDTNGWFEWACYDPPGPGPVEMYTIRRSSSLRQYINFGTQTWLTNDVSVSNGFSTPATVWWGNTIQSVPAGGVSMNTADAIYVTTGNLTMTGAITVLSDNVSFVTAPGTSMVTNVAAHQISVNNHRFVWIETNMSHIDGTGSSSGIFIRDSAFITVENSRLANYPGFGSAGQVRLINNRALLFRNMMIANNPSSSAITVYADSADSHHLWFDRIRAYNNMAGIFFRGNNPSVVRDMLVTRSLIHNNDGSGIYVDQGIQNSLFMNLLVANNGGSGIYLQGSVLSGGNTVVNVVSVNNQNGGLIPGDSSQFINLGLSDNGGADVLAPAAVGNFYSGALFSGRAGVGPDDQDGRCIAVGPGSGMQNDDDCSPEGPSDHTVVSAFDLADQFVGPNGIVGLYLIGNNWFAVANDFSGIGNSLTVPPAYPANSYRDRCDGTVLTGCREFDWQLLITAPSPGFRNALACPDTLPTMSVTHTFSSGTYTFLRNAYALETDADWDLPMCMGDEACLYTPNLGPYQGHAGLTNSGCTDLVADPTFGNVDFQEFNSNGVP